jgi:hypothetical protein
MRSRPIALVVVVVAAAASSAGSALRAAPMFEAGESTYPSPERRNDPPSVEHQPPGCTIASKPSEICALVTDDGDIAKVRLYYRKPGEKDYFLTEMAFTGAQFCATLPGIRSAKAKSIEYYISAVDTEHESRRTSTYPLQAQTEAECEFPAIQKDAARAAAVVVNATTSKQPQKLPDYFEPAGVTYTPLPKK